MNTSGKSIYWVIVIVIIGVIAGGWYFLKMGEEVATLDIQGEEQDLVIPTVQMATQAEDQADKPDFSQFPLFDEQALPVEFSEPLPELADSDSAFTQDLLAMSAQLKPSLFIREVIRKVIFSVNDLSQGLRPPVKRLRELSFNQPFSVYKVDNKMYMSRDSYQRYDQLAQAIDAIDSKAAVNLYQKYFPLFQQVFSQLSYPEHYQLMDIIKAAAAKVMDAPVIKGKVEVIRPSVRYKFASSRLEKLSALDKQMLRMGPENTQMIQDKLRELVEALIDSEKNKDQ